MRQVEGQSPRPRDRHLLINDGQEVSSYKMKARSLLLITIVALILVACVPIPPAAQTSAATDPETARSEMTAVTQMKSDAAKPEYVTDLETAYGAPSQAGFGSAVFYEPLKASETLDEAALAKYKYFVGDLWERYGEDAWMGPWKMVYTRPADGKRDIVAELRGITDREARMAVENILDNVEDPEKARAALSAAFDAPATTELMVYNTGDGAAMSGVLVAGAAGEAGEATFLVFLLD